MISIRSTVQRLWRVSHVSGAAAFHRTPSSSQAEKLETGKLHCWYADHQEVILPDGHRFPMDKYRETRLILQAESQTSAFTSFTPSPAAPKDDLHRQELVKADHLLARPQHASDNVSPSYIVRVQVHTSDYVERFEKGLLSEKEMRAIGFPWTESVVRRNFASVGGTLAAAKALLAQPELRMTAHVSGGTHHSFSDRGEGFCVFNDIAVAVAYALDAHNLQRILVIDLDVHQGNGTAEIFENDYRVTTFDVFCDENYPWATRRTNTYDIALKSDITDEEYLSMLEQELAALKKHDPQLIVYQAGVDSLADDALGKMSLSRETLAGRNNMVYSFALDSQVPLLITMGGGYAKPDIMKSVVCHADVYRAAAFRLAALKGE